MIVFFCLKLIVLSFLHQPLRYPQMKVSMTMRERLMKRITLVAETENAHKSPHKHQSARIVVPNLKDPNPLQSQGKTRMWSAQRVQM